jgi:CheY-like chemotaxis protein
MAERSFTPPPCIVALVDDLFFVLKIEDTARQLGLPIAFAGSAAEFFARLKDARRALVIADLTMGGVDLASLFAQLRASPQHAAVPVLGYTTHADWKRTSPLHGQCTTVVTKDRLSQHLAALMQQLLPQG